MSYAQYGLIQAAQDYNTLANGTNKLNSVLAVGTGNVGYGQTSVANVTSGTSVTATQWTTMFNAVNKVVAHQTNSTSANIGTVTVGNIITFIANLDSKINTAYNNASGFGAQGTTTTGSGYTPNFTAPDDTNSAQFDISRVATFESADKARYFFNAGGQLNFVVTSVTNGGSTNRGASLATLAATNFTSLKFGGMNNAGRTGSNGTVTSSNTSVAYHTLTTSNANAIVLTSTASAYTSDQLWFAGKSNGTQGSYNDHGSVVTLSLTLFSAAQSPAFNDSIDITVNHRVDVIYPETTFLANTWGSVTIS